MSAWKRVWENDFAAFGKRSLLFASHDGQYCLVIDEHDQDGIRVQLRGKELRWYIELKEVCGDTYRLSGMGWGDDSFLPESFWFELLLTSPGILTLWGNQVVLRRDQEA